MLYDTLDLTIVGLFWFITGLFVMHCYRVTRQHFTITQKLQAETQQKNNPDVSVPGWSNGQLTYAEEAERCEEQHGWEYTYGYNNTTIETKENDSTEQ